MQMKSRRFDHIRLNIYGRKIFRCNEYGIKSGSHSYHVGTDLETCKSGILKKDPLGDIE